MIPKNADKPSDRGVYHSIACLHGFGYKHYTTILLAHNLHVASQQLQNNSSLFFEKYTYVTAMV